MNLPRAAGPGGWTRPAHRRIVGRLQGFVRDVRTDPVFRRALGAEPRAALARHLLDCDLAPPTLPAGSGQDDLLINEAQLFGLAPGAAVPSPPLEARLVGYGAKPLALLHGSENELVGLVRWAAGRGLTAVLSPHEWDRVEDEGKGGFSNLADAPRRARAGSNAWRSLLIGADENHVLLGWLSLAYGWDAFLGRLLGYPACCSQAFVERWPEAVARHQGDLAAMALAASGAGPHDWRTNLFGRYFGYGLVQHFPCRFDCAQTVALAARVAHALDCFEPALLAQSRAALEGLALYTEREGVAMLPGARMTEAATGSTVAYDRANLLLTAPEGPLGSALRGGGTLRPAPHGFRIDERPFDGCCAWFTATTAGHPATREADALSQRAADRAA